MNTIVVPDSRRRRTIVLIVVSALVISGTVISLLWSFGHPRIAPICDPSRIWDCKGLAEAQEIYHRTDYTGNHVLKYATSIQELEGKDGKPGLAGRTMVSADLTRPEPQPHGGYLFKVLLAQGPHAEGGQDSYIDEDGNMTRGYAFVACPAEYNSLGTITYMISNKGTLYFKDLGSNTRRIVEALTTFDPDSTWQPVR